MTDRPGGCQAFSCLAPATQLSCLDMSARPTLFAPCSSELLSTVSEAAKKREQTMAGFIRIAVTRAVEEAGFRLRGPASPPARKKKLARANGKG